MVVLNGGASVFSALATVLCEAGGKWTVACLALGAALCLQCPQLPALEGRIRMLLAIMDYCPTGGLNKWLDKTPGGRQFQGKSR